MQGYMSVVLELLLKTDIEIVGICTDEQIKLTQKLRKTLGHLLRDLKIKIDKDFIYKDPFEDLVPPNKIAKLNKIRTFNINELKSGTFFNSVKKSKPDLILAAGFPKLIPKTIVELAKSGAYNIHPSILPRYRGGTPLRWMILNSEPELGVSIHKLADKFDTGDILFQQRVETPHYCTWGQAELEILKLLPDTMRNFLNIINQNDIILEKQNERISSFFPPFHGHLHQINWCHSADKIFQQSLAVKPKTGLRSKINNQQVCFWDIKPLIKIQQLARPGQVIALRQNKFLDICCGENQGIRVKSVLYNSRIRSIEFLVKNYNIKEGDVFI